MEARELRIGNYVYYNDKVISIAPNAINEFYYIGDTHSESLVDRRCYEPIELTEEILLKCGFVLKGIIFRINNGFSNQFDINYSLSRDMFYYDSSKYGVYTEVEIKYLHQLQNLYFALTNEELNVQL